MSGDDVEEYLVMLERGKVLAGKVQSSLISRRDAEITYRERWILSVGYCLPIAQFTEK